MMGSTASSARRVAPVSCSCFSLCTAEDAAAFRSRVPRWINSTDSPWHGYLLSVYGASPAPPLPFDLGSLSYFYHVWPFGSCELAKTSAQSSLLGLSHDAHDVRPRSVPSATCAPEICAPWLEPRAAPRASVRDAGAALAFLANKSAVGGCKHCARTATENALQMDIFLVPPSGLARTRATRLAEPLLEKSRSRWGTDSVPTAGFYTPGLSEQDAILKAWPVLGHGEMARSGEWLEVARLNVAAYWHGKTSAGALEGVNGNGVWFNPAKGSGIYLNVGKTVWVHHKGQGPTQNLTRLWRAWHAGLQSDAARNASLARLQKAPRGEVELAMALDLGFDSVQFQFNKMRHFSELVLVGPAFSHGPRAVRTCPPDAERLLRTGWGASGRACDRCDDRDPVLNC